MVQYVQWNRVDPSFIPRDTSRGMEVQAPKKVTAGREAMPWSDGHRGKAISYANRSSS